MIPPPTNEIHARVGFRSYFTRENMHRQWHATLRRIGFAHLPSITRRKFEIACRTSYTSLLCISLIYIAKPSFGPSGFLAPIVSAVSSGSLYFGAWAGDLWKVTYAVPLCRFLPFFSYYYYYYYYFFFLPVMGM